MRVWLGHAWHESPRNVRPAPRPITLSLRQALLGEGFLLAARSPALRPAEHAQCTACGAPPELRSSFSAALGGGVGEGVANREGRGESWNRGVLPERVGGTLRTGATSFSAR